MDKRSKDGLSNFLSIIGAGLILMGIVTAIVLGMKDGSAIAFWMCLTGTIMTFVGSYVKHGYFKFFS